MVWYSLEAPYGGAYNGYQNMFLWRNKKNINNFLAEKGPIMSYVMC